MRTKLAVSTLILILFTATFVFGQSWDHTKGIGITGSLFKFVGGNVDRAAPGTSGGLSLK
jgi:hypothetical protein